jgi:hypothetical protein
MSLLLPILARRLSAAACLCLTALAAPAEVRGLVIGVSDYEYLDADLRGPANDVGLVSSMLLARGATPASLTILAAPDVRLAEGLTVCRGAAPGRDPGRARPAGGRGDGRRHRGVLLLGPRVSDARCQRRRGGRL